MAEFQKSEICESKVAQLIFGKVFMNFNVWLCCNNKTIIYSLQLMSVFMIHYIILIHIITHDTP